MDAFLAALTPADVVRLKELVVLSYLAGFGTLAICRFILRLVRQPAAWRSFFTSPSFLVATVSALVALAIYLQQPPMEVGTESVASEDIVLWGVNKVDALKLIEVIILTGVAWSVIVFGVRPILNALFNAMQTRFPAQPAPAPSISFGKTRLLVLAAVFVGMASFMWYFLAGTLFNKTSFDKITASVTEAVPRLYGLTKPQLLGIAEVSVLATVTVLIVWLVIRPLFRRALATLGVHPRGTLRTLNLSAIAITVATVVLSLWRVYEIASL